MRGLRLAAIVAFALAILPLACGSVQAAQVQDLRVGRHSDKTRLVFDLSAPVTYTAQTLVNPPRVVLDISSVDGGQPPQPPLADTPISGVQMTATAQGGIQVTLFLSHPVTTRSFLLPPHQDRGDRLVVDIYGRTPQAVAIPQTGNTEIQTGTVPAVTRPAKKPAHPTSARASPRETVSRPVSPAPDQSAPQFGFSGTWEQEWAYQTEKTGNQKFEAIVEPRLDVNFSSGTKMVAIARIRLDTVGDLGPFEQRPDNYSGVNGPIYNDENAELSLRELYLDTEWAGTYWRLGKQQVVWGQADGIKVLDVVNPQSFREFILDDFDDSRIPLWMVNAEMPLDVGSLQLLWIPDTTYHELAEADTPYFLTSPRWVPQPAPGQAVKVSSFDKPDDPLSDSDLGIRYSAFLAGWDITLNYLYHYQDYPVLYQQLEQSNGTDVLHVEPTYKRNHLTGATLSNSFDSFTLRAEVAYSTDTYHTTGSQTRRGIHESAELASVVGLDWQYSSDGLLSAQWFLSYLPDYSQDIIRDENENIASLLFQQSFTNEAWQLRVLGLYSLDDEDTMLQIKLKYWLMSNLEVWLGGDFFHGTQRGTFGQFEDQSRGLIGLEYGF
ncbi:MAG: hypothetical protein DRR04_13625 [Gammaproteobacteria bacterium]|nr:MAG: hypothetical protein DRR04_13625 [Gammaproteobacteria bacterium]